MNNRRCPHCLTPTTAPARFTTFCNVCGTEFVPGTGEVVVESSYETDEQGKKR